MARTNRSRIWERGAYLALAGLALAQGGCLAIAAGAAAAGAAAGACYLYGKDTRGYNAGFPDTAAAVKAALQDLGMPVLGEEFKDGSGSIESRTGDGDKVRIYLDTLPGKFPAEGDWTKVSVRVATFGDHPVGQRLLDQIAMHLVPAPPGAVPPPPGSPPPPGAPPVAQNPTTPRFQPVPQPTGATTSGTVTPAPRTTSVAPSAAPTIIQASTNPPPPAPPMPMQTVQPPLAK